ncbi:hypothetical protein OS493_031243 [Desmophyllum pertusum]|uniref:Uncharacterized protein n=1 Tax=Desmophyllum pertusum TaxID=174260 RepID=A0A9W9Z8P0_9CNID|nr:hypothetical protein OS493_031243 [Desmophyllum pertusum]
MHAVLVCSQADGAGRFGAYPSVPAEDVNNEAVVTRTKMATGLGNLKQQQLRLRVFKLIGKIVTSIVDGNTWPSHFIYLTNGGTTQRTRRSWPYLIYKDHLHPPPE